MEFRSHDKDFKCFDFNFLFFFSFFISLEKWKSIGRLNRVS